MRTSQTTQYSLGASLRFLAMFAGVILVFGLGGSIILAAFDKAQTASTAPLLEPGTIAHGVVHFIQTLFAVFFTGTNRVGVPFWKLFLSGLATTIEFCFISMPLALVSGFIVALMSRSKVRLLRLPARAFVEFIRNTPLLVQMVVIYYGLAFLPQWLVNPATAGIATLTINYCAYEAENLRGGLMAIDRGQNEAAMTLGLGQWETLRLVLTPQMIPISLPTVINDFIYMFKDSSILSLITIQELTLQTNVQVRHFPQFAWQFFTIASILYLLLSLPLGRVARAAEARLRTHTLAQGRNLTSLAGQGLGVSVVVGWVAGALAIGISLGALWVVATQLVRGTLFTAMLLIALMLILGIPVYLIGSLIGAARSRGSDKIPKAPEPESALALAQK